MVFKKIPEIPQRLLVGLMMFTGTFVTYLLRVNMSMAIIPMVANLSGNTTSVSALETMTFDWSSTTQGVVLGSYFYGYLITSVPGGMMAERYGARHVVAWTMLVASVATMLHPLAAAWDASALIVLRVIVGLMGGVQFPALHALLARWAPLHERGKFMACLMGGAIGTIFTWSICGLIINALNWEWSFYIVGGICVAWSGLWFYIVADTPNSHPRITVKEKEYINKHIRLNSKKSKAIPPFKSIAISLPYWCMVILHFGSNWGLHFIMTAAPMFISTVLGFNIASTGILSGLPYLARFSFSIIFGNIADFIISRRWMSTVVVRKSFCTFSHIIPGILLFLIGYVGRSQAVAIALITLSTGSNGAASVTNLQNHQDLSPNFAGTIYGFANMVGSSAGFIAPLVTAYFTRDENGFDQWQSIFIVGATIYTATAIFFIIFGSAAVQSWNEIPDSDPDKEKAAEVNETVKT